MILSHGFDEIQPIQHTGNNNESSNRASNIISHGMQLLHRFDKLVANARNRNEIFTKNKLCALAKIHKEYSDEF